ncbi:hypothetical protein M6D93_03190 [Jatrophihabitans telluris]|uniref:Uncharacterized protein n=1 Tax=Jatrophihabitans telluris TaxID=2038343 RepID=A0ABY4R0H4_9ACTN|nr:hypothetical protein [Jatrophihabitans telluris]UQX89012.1 hypothetical protein M6D93_03190 [Jatrophihabitans telluris]
MSPNGTRGPQASDDLDALIRSALTARADQVVETMLRPAAPPQLTDNRSATILRWPWAGPVLAAAAVAALAVGTSTIVHRADGHHAPPASPSGTPMPHQPVPTFGPTPVPTSSPTRSATPSGTGSSSRPSTGPSASTSPAPSGSSGSSGSGSTTFELGYQPLWPFADGSQVAAWQSAHQTNGSQPWHLDAGETALFFTRNYLGFTELTRVTITRVDDTGAHVGVGYLDPNGTTHTSAVLHLLRFGTTSQAPWEVVGSDDTTLSLEQPAYGSSVSSPVAVGGHITGVDEAIRVSVRSLASGGATAPVLASVPAGGNHSPWSTGPIDLRLHGTLTIVASTGGHLQQVERFAIQGVTAN